MRITGGGKTPLRSRENEGTSRGVGGVVAWYVAADRGPYAAPPIAMASPLRRAEGWWVAGAVACVALAAASHLQVGVGAVGVPTAP